MNKIKRSLGEHIFEKFNIAFLILLMFIMVYPVWHVLCASFSDGNQIVGYSGLLLFPRGFTVQAYKMMAMNPMIIGGYCNTIFIVVVGVSINIILTSVAAYFLSRKDVFFRNHLMLMIVFTMYFSGGLIPFYFTVKDVGLTNTLWALIIPNAISTFNLIIMRTSFMNIPDSLDESAKLDGAGHFTMLFRIVLPLSKAVVAVMVLYYSVAHWNAWFNAMLFLENRKLFPLQLVLREIVIQGDTSSMTQNISSGDKLSIGETIKYAVTVVATIPILCLYPFVQKHFAKGVMIGALKG